MLRPFTLVSVVALAMPLSACKRTYGVGDRVMVEWEKKNYPAVIIEAPKPTKYKVHYDGYDTVWDEEVARDRIKGFVEGTVVPPEPPEKVRAKALQAVQSNVFKIG